MSAKYKIIFREESRSSGDSPLKWEPESPLAMSAVQISRNTETSESYLQVKALNISAKMIGEVHAEANVQYSDDSFEKLSLDDLDADIKPGEAYTFNAVKLSRGDATRADVKITRIKLSDGTSWESKGQAVAIVPGDSIGLPSGFLTARLSYLADAGCNDVPSAVHKVRDQGKYWVCSCGQVNLSRTCARCKLDKRAALNSESVEFLEKVIADKKEAAEKAEKEKQQKRGKAKRIGIITGVAVVAIVAVFAIASLISQNIGTQMGGTGKGVYVVSKSSYVDSDGKNTVVEYEISEQGNALKANYIKPETETYSYNYDDYGNVVECNGGKYPYKRSIDAVDDYGQPTKITQTYSDGDESTDEIAWYGEGHVKSVTSKTPSIGYTNTTYFNESGEITRRVSTFDNTGVGIGISRYYNEYTYEHDKDGKVVSRTDKDEDGRITTTKYEYDDNGNVIRTIENGKTDTEYEYVYVEEASPAVVMKNNHFMRDCGF